jgi:hypothetical protein
MKNLLIASSLLFAFSGSFAQEKGSKNIKPIKAPSSVSKGIGSEVESYKTGSGNVKPIKGQSSSTSTKVVRPSKTTPVKVQRVSSNTSTRAAAGSRPTYNEKATGKGDKSSSVNTRAAAGSKPTYNEKATGKGDKSSSVNSRNETKGKSELESREYKTFNELEKTKSSDIRNSQYCKGWVDGYKKAYSKISKVNIELSDIPKCEMNGKCEEYECGYRAGMMKAELKTKR